jgi:hypothetical protein
VSERGICTRHGHRRPANRTRAVAALTAVAGDTSTARDISAEDLVTVRRRCSEGLAVLGLRFSSDRFVPDERFAFLRTQLGASFIAIELDDDHANPDAVLAPHSVLTEHLIDEPGQPTRQALDSVLDHFRTRLLVATGHNG